MSVTPASLGGRKHGPIALLGLLASGCSMWVTPSDPTGLSDLGLTEVTSTSHTNHGGNGSPDFSLDVVEGDLIVAGVASAANRIILRVDGVAAQAVVSEALAEEDTPHIASTLLFEPVETTGEVNITIRPSCICDVDFSVVVLLLRPTDSKGVVITSGIGATGTSGEPGIGDPTTASARGMFEVLALASNDFDFVVDDSAWSSGGNGVSVAMRVAPIGPTSWPAVAEPTSWAVATAGVIH